MDAGTLAESVFGVLDPSGEGVVTTQKIIQFLRGLGYTDISEAELEQKFAQVTQGSAQLSLSQLQLLLSSTYNRIRKRDTESENLKRSLDSLASLTGENGHISALTLRQMMASAGSPWTDEEFLNFLQLVKADVNLQFPVRNIHRVLLANRQ
eukprot:TRINITY_DN15078_c0_g1_i4.p1 TRINITY_DN15078_c0_g1~~TRINITY_DN15078_c0_g1_i4.p1  ORF type:complete len:152 (-),score=20.55 TRINITY_DN15078_c0_g1_i4:387-842(-)